ncbi:MAG: glycosyltransferase [Flavobacteriales bacterium]|nr:glycosyltransferase [Flavobacteriales bacterium]
MKAPTTRNARSMADKAPILIVSHTFPPYRGIGGRRWVKFAKALARRGHAVHVIHSAGGGDLLGSLWTDDLSTPGIHVHPLPQRYPTVLFKRPLATVLEKVMYRFWSFALPLFTKGNWFDKTIFWERPFLRLAGTLIQEHGIRNVLITGAPFRLLYYGTLLKRSHPIRLVSDLRDTWTWQDGYGGGLLGLARKAFEKELERKVMEESDHIVSPHPAVVDHLRHAYPSATGRIALLGHAIDPDELGPPRPAHSPKLLRLIYAGSMYGASEADAYFNELLKGFAALREKYPESFAVCRSDLYITGHGTARYREQVERAGLSDRILFHEPLPAKEIFPRIAAADAVILFIPSGNKDVLGTKFTEIFYLGRPVIHVGAPGSISAYITSNGLGVTLPVEELANALPELMSGARQVHTNTAYDPRAHLLDHIAEGMERTLLLPPTV